MMAFSPLLLSAEYGWSGVLLSAGVTGLLMLMLIMTMQQYLFAPVTRVPRLLALVAAGLLVYPSTESRVVGAMLAVAVMAVNYRGQPEVAARS
jgi:TRAP-type uncharacterized transport system fused permease subunit